MMKVRTPVMVEITLHPASLRFGLNNSNCNNMRIAVDVNKNATDTKNDHLVNKNSKFMLERNNWYASNPNFTSTLGTMENSESNNNVLAVADVTIDERLKQKLSSDVT
mmetsp:Transcript_6597/g.18936  ORF Transcript_6597/g.18936 Transcript_6597/m.18936 type:complete len:108 (+) Transcript_6597:1591-1914(+)